MCVCEEKMKVNLKVFFLVLLILNPGVMTLTESEKKTESKQDRFHRYRHYRMYSRQIYNPDFGSRDYRFSFESPWQFEDKTFKQKKGEVPSLHVINDKIKAPGAGQANKAEIKLHFLYEIKDNFQDMPSIFKIGFNIYFLIEDAVERKNEKFDGLYRINEDPWYELITGSRFNLAADMGENRILGYSIRLPRRLYGFRQSFRNPFYIEFPDLRFRLALHKLTDNKFLFHNFRAAPSDYAVEVYGMDGTRIKEFFDYVPFDLKPFKRVPLAIQTVLTTDKKGHIYIAFQYPLNPYRVWKFDENGKKRNVFGNYFVEPEEYQTPEEWLRLSSKDIQYYGLRQIYAINKLLVDSKGRVFVFFSKNRIVRPHRGKDVQRYFLDIYSKDGDFIGRTEFPYGFPELIDYGIIYSRMKDTSGRRMWKITAVGLSIQ